MLTWSASAAWALPDDNVTPAAKTFLEVARPKIAQASILRMEKTGDGLPIFRQVLDKAKVTFRRDPASLADVVMDIGEEEIATGDGGQGIAWRMQAVELYRVAYGPRDHHVVEALDKHICLLVCDESALPSLRQTIADLTQPGDVANRVRLLKDLGIADNTLGFSANGEDAFRQALAFEAAHPALADSSIFGGLAQSLEAQGRMAEATSALQSALTLDQRVSLGRRNFSVLSDEQALANAFASRGLFETANKIYSDVIGNIDNLGQPTLGGSGDVLAQDDWGILLTREGRFAEAETTFNKLIADRHLESGPVSADDEFEDKILPLIHAARNLMAEGKLGPAKAEFQIAAERADPEGVQDPEAAEAYAGLANLAQLQNDSTGVRVAARKALFEFRPMLQQLLPENQILAGRLLRLAGRPAEALSHLGQTCRDSGRIDLLDLEPLRHPDCNLELALTLWDRHEASALSPSQVDIEGAFLASQRAIQSSAGDAMARAAALAAASLHGDADLANRYEASLAKRDALASSLGQASIDSSAAGRRRQTTLQSELIRASQDSVLKSAQLRKREPRYWELRSPSPTSFAELTAATATGTPPLLHPHEALVLLLAPAGPEHGLVFVISQSSHAWARIGLRGDELDKIVRTIRSQIDPQAYGSKDRSADARPLDRRLAYRLYEGIFGAPSLVPVLASADTLLIAASGPLLSLPPGLLVTKAPVGDDGDPKARRATAWLLRDKAIAILPTVASLRLLRGSAKRVTSDALPLRGFADPDFTPISQPTIRELHTDATAKRDTSQVQNLYRDGIVDPFALASFPPLPGTRLEGQALERELKAPQSILYGRDASKTRLKAADRDGSLAKARVLEFATHAIVAGDLSGLAQPALILARPTTLSLEDNGLLTSSEAALLTLNADWVILSACNTASPDGGSAEGLSGLARSFLYAGARSVLASHWEVLDNAGEQVVTALFEPGSSGLSKAHALQRAELQVLDDSRFPENSDPFVWAPYVLIGDPDE